MSNDPRSSVAGAPEPDLSDTPSQLIAGGRECGSALDDFTVAPIGGNRGNELPRPKRRQRHSRAGSQSHTRRVAGEARDQTLTNAKKEASTDE